MLQVALKPIATLAATASTDDGIVDTYNWDTAFALSYDHANAAITATWTPITINQSVTDDDTGATYAINATFDPWQITTDGDGKNVNFSCPIKSDGTSSYTHGIKKDSLDNVSFEIQVEMQWVPDPSQTYVALSGTDIPAFRTALVSGTIPSQLGSDLKSHNITLTQAATVSALDPKNPTVAWKITDTDGTHFYYYYLFYTTDKEGDKFIQVYSFDSSWIGNLKMLTADTTNSSGSSSPVVLINIANVPSTLSSTASAMLSELVAAWFNTNLNAFSHILAILDISIQLDQNDQWQWLKPTATSYAVIDEGTTGQSVFGVLTMTGGNQAPLNQQISPNAIPEGADAGFVISGPLFMDKIMLPGAMGIFDTTDAKLFEHPPSTDTNQPDPLIWTNVGDLTWGPFITSDTPTHTYTDAGSGSLTCDIKTTVSQLDSSSTAGFVQIYWGSGDFKPQLSDQLGIPGNSPVTVKVQGSEWYVVDSSNANNQFAVKLENNALNVYSAAQLHIPAKQFTMSLNNSEIEVSFVNINYAYSSDYNVHINYSESWQLGIKEVDGRNIFWYSQIGNQGLAISVSKTQTAITRDIVEAAIGGALGLIAIAAPIFEGLYNAAQIGEVTDEGAEVVVTSDAFQKAAVDNPTEAETDEAAAGSQAANQSGWKWANIKAAFKTPKWKAFGAITALVGVGFAGDQTAAAIIENAATGTWSNVPTFDKFANLCIAPYTFPNIQGFTLQDAKLAQSFVISLKLSNS